MRGRNVMNEEKLFDYEAWLNMMSDYDETPYHPLLDLNCYYDAFKKSMKDSSWKGEPQKFETDWLSQIVKLRNELANGTYKSTKKGEFVAYERGRARHIHSCVIRDRIIRHNLCDNVIRKAIEPYIIYNNGASQKGKGTSFARKIFERDLHNYWLEHGNNDGYVVIMDFSKFYDNIAHERLREMLSDKVDDLSMWLIDEILSQFRVDVSYMEDDEYQHCMDTIFESMWYYENVGLELRTGEKFMDKSVDIGDQFSQDVGVLYPTRIDNYATIVMGHKHYGRYMDDIYFICDNLDKIHKTIDGITKTAKELGLFINEKKTRICKLSSTFIYLQTKYFLTDKGRVVKRINPKSLTRERRKLKAYKRLLDAGKLEYDTIKNAYKSWYGSYYKIMSKKQRENMNCLYKFLFKEGEVQEIGWI